jgi:hypothetical protein
MKQIDIINNNKIKKNKYWYKLDNAARVFPAILSKRYTSMFRLAVILKSPVRVAALQFALENVLERFPYFKVKLKKGIFWDYLETNTKEPFVSKELLYPCMSVAGKNSNKYLFFIRAYNNRISCEFSHILTDGHGALVFLKSLTAEYLKATGITIKDYGDIFRLDQTPHPGEFEDGFKKYFTEKIPAPKQAGRAFHLPFDLFPKGIHKIITGLASVKDILEKASEKNVSLTEFLLSVYINSFQILFHSLTKSQKKHCKEIIRILVPVNLRRLYDSRSMRNFFLTVSPEIDLRLGKYSFDEIIKKIHHSMQIAVDSKNINQQISKNIKREINPLIRIIPLILKNPALSFLFMLKGNNPFTSSFSNLGNVVMPEQFHDYIERFDFIPPPGPVSKVNLSVVSFNNILSMSFGRVIEEQVIEQLFFRQLAGMGINVKIHANIRYWENFNAILP